MIPSKNWFPTNLQDRAAWYDNFNTQIQIIGAALGLTAPERDSIGEDNQMLQFLATTAVTIDAYTDGIRQFRKTITEGDIGDPTPVFPADIVLAAPAGTVTTGIFERLDNFVKRIRVAPAYTPDDGALLGIIPSPSEGFVPEGAKPVLEASPVPGNVVEVRFVRGKSDGVNIQISIDKGDWAAVGNFFKSPAALTIPQNEGELPRSVQVRARYLVGNSAVGDYSDIVTVQTIP